MTNVMVNAHAPDRETFEACMVKYGLAVTGEDGFVPHPELRISADFPVLRDTGETDSEGLPVLEPVAGYHANLWAVGRLAGLLLLHPVTGEPYPQTDEVGGLLDVTQRTRMRDVATGGDFVFDGAPGNPKLPGGFEADNVRFFDPVHLASPANIWA